MPAHCPHCLLVVAKDAEAGDGPWPPRPMRCPHCRLSIATGRARLDVDATTPAASGSAAGVLANAARRAEADSVSDAAVTDALRFAAGEVGIAVGRLRMIDYQQVSDAHPPLPSLASIVESCGGWKRARQLASTSSR